MLIRPATIKDGEEILRITKAAFGLYQDALGSQNIPVVALSETLEKTNNDIVNNNVYVAEADGRIVGSIRFLALSKDLAYIYRFGVDPEINNTGVGSQLIEYAIEKIASKGYAAICLHTNSKYYKLARYYYGKGFYVHSTDMSKGYIRALFLRDLKNVPYDLSPAFLK